MNIKAILASVAMVGALSVGIGAAHAGEVLVQGLGAFGPNTPTTAISAPNESFTFAFDVSNPYSGTTTDGTDYTNQFSNFSYTLDNQPVSDAATSVGFATIGLTIDLSNATLFLEGPLDNLTGSGLGTGGIVISPSFNSPYIVGVTNSANPVIEPEGIATVTSVNVSAAPEPSTWALMVAGIGLMGAALRLGRRNAFVRAA